MSGMPRPTPRVLPGGFLVPRHPATAGGSVPVAVASVAEGWAEAELRYRALVEATGKAESARVNLGIALLELKRRTGYGDWRATLQAKGVHRNTAWRSMQDAAEFLGMPAGERERLMPRRERVRDLVKLSQGGTSTPEPEHGGAKRAGGDMGGFELPDGVSLDMVEDEVLEDAAAQVGRSAPPETPPEEGSAPGGLRLAGFEDRAGGVGAARPHAADRRGEAGDAPTQRTAGAGSSRDEVIAKGRRQDVAGQLPMSRLYDAIDGVLAGLERVRNADLSGVGGAARSRLMELLGLVSRGIDEVLSPFSSSSCDGPGSNDPGSSSPVAAGV